MKKNKHIQDDRNENATKDRFQLHDSGESRHGTDAIDENGNTYELKGGTRSNGYSSCRSLGYKYLDRQQFKHWIFSDFENGKIVQDYYVPPSKMEIWYSSIRDKLDESFSLLNEVMQCWIAAKTPSPDEIEIVKKCHDMGYRLNDPTIPKSFVVDNGYKLMEPYNTHLRSLVLHHVGEGKDKSQNYNSSTLDKFYDN